MSWIKSFLTANWLWLVKIAAILGAVIAVFRAGGRSEQLDRMQKNLKAIEKAHGIENRNDALGDDDIDKRLRTRWKR